ncbi:MAG: hypothetical protein JST54_17730 [Deltaproteobacteria bacterium]|nr:hypothetical protein [Deltaproteobacteria bacterium]
MTSERSLGIASALLLLCACGGGVHDLSVSAPPLVVIHGHVDTASLIRQDPSAPLVGALVWATIPNIDPLCQKYQDAGLACPDLYGVFPGQIEASVPIAADGSFTISLSALPDASVSVGDDQTRIAYGTLVVAEDLDGDGQLTIFGVVSKGEGEGHFGGPVGGQQDNVVAASFYSLHASQQRLVFREGGFAENSNFYPAPGCDDPPQGFSFLSAPPYSPAGDGGCSHAPVSTVIEVHPLTADEALTFLCETIDGHQLLGEAQENPDPIDPSGKSGTVVCLGSDYLAIVETGPFCPTMWTYGLSGCADDPFCITPEWDHTAAKPSWWPCP